MPPLLSQGQLKMLIPSIVNVVVVPRLHPQLGIVIQRQRVAGIQVLALLLHL
jgi:hypothetical protein